MTVSAAVTSGPTGLVAPVSRTLTITDNETAPTVTLKLDPASISAGQTSSSGTVTITAENNVVDAPDRRVTVTGTATGGNGVGAPANRTLTITNDEETPRVTLALDPTSITESGGVSTVTASLNGLSSADVLTATAVAPAVAGDFTLSGNRELTITAGQTESTGEVRVTAVGNTVDAPNKSVEVTASVTGGNGVTAPDSRTLTITDDEVLPVVTLALDPASIGERGGVSTVTASLDRPSSQRVTVTVSAGAGLPRYDERLPARRDDADDRAGADGDVPNAVGFELM